MRIRRASCDVCPKSDGKGQRAQETAALEEDLAVDDAARAVSLARSLLPRVRRAAITRTFSLRSGVLASPSSELGPANPDNPKAARGWRRIMT